MTPVPPNFWTVIMTLASVAIAALSLLVSVNKSDMDETRSNERRICRLEALSAVGECKK